jgi:DNA polymerase III epsilon subunit-like protein
VTQHQQLVTQPDELLHDDDTNSEMSLDASTDQDINAIDLTKTIYVVFDLETTGLNRRKHKIIEIAAQ